jgi:predicted membrane protein
MTGVALFIIFLLCLGFFFYFIPTFVARSRGHKDLGAIFFINLFIGWTLLGWLICLIWAMSGENVVVVQTREATPSKATEIEKLVALKNAGHLSDEEFQSAKKRILESTN